MRNWRANRLGGTLTDQASRPAAPKVVVSKYLDDRASIPISCPECGETFSRASDELLANLGEADECIDDDIDIEIDP